MLPDVIFVGPTKCGTTWIDTYLRTREEVVLPSDCKETFFFDKAFDKGVPWYESHFRGQGDTCVEVAPSLFHKPDALASVRAVCPNARIVIMFRDPFERVVSHYFHYRKQGVAQMPVAEMATRHPDMIEASLFHKYSLMWMEAFPGQVSFVSYDLLKSDPVAFCSVICDVTGIPDTVPPADALAGRAVNAASLPRSAALAHLTRRGAEMARRMGGHGLVNWLRKTGLKKLAFSGGGDVNAERDAVKRDVLGLTPQLAPDLSAFNATYGSKIKGI